MFKFLFIIYFFIFDLFGVALPAVPSTVSGFDISHLVFSSAGSSVASGFQDASRVTDSYAFGFTTVLNQLAVYHYTSCFDYQGGNYCIYTIYHHYGSATCATGTSPSNGYCISSGVACPSGKFSVNSVCVDNPCRVGKSITKVPNNDGSCRVPTAAELVAYKDDARLCHLHGGFTTFKSPVDLSLSWPKSSLTFQSPVNQCLPVAVAAADRNWFLGTSVALTPLFNKLFPALGVFVDGALDKAGLAIKNLLEKVDPVPFDFKIGLPKIGPGGAIDTEIISSPIPDGPLGDAPSRGSAFDVDAYNSFLRNEWFPKNPNSVNPNDPYIDMAVLDRFSKSNLNFKDNGTDPVTHSFKPNTSNIFNSTRGAPSIEPLMDTPVMVADPVYAPKPSYIAPVDTAPKWNFAPIAEPAPPPVPYKYADIPVSHSVVVSPSPIGGGNVVQWNNTRTYPDGSTSLETTKIDESIKKGSTSITTVSQSGFSSTTSSTFDVPNYVAGSSDPRAYDVVKTSPVSTTPLPINYNAVSPYSISSIDPSTGYPIPSTVTPGTNTLPSTATGQDLLNAPMPSYSFPALAEFVPFDANPITDMISGAELMFSNIRDQITSTTTVFDNTKTMLQGGWTPPVIPAGSCGESLSFNFHGKHIDLCPPLVNATAVGAPIVTPVVTIGGMVLSVTIMIGGF